MLRIEKVFTQFLLFTFQYYIFMKIFKNNDDETLESNKIDEKTDKFTEFSMPEVIKSGLYNSTVH